MPQKLGPQGRSPWLKPALSDEKVKWLYETAHPVSTWTKMKRSVGLEPEMSMAEMRETLKPKKESEYKPWSSKPKSSALIIYDENGVPSYDINVEE